MFTGVCPFVNYPFLGFFEFSIGMFYIFLSLLSCKSFFYMEDINPQFNIYVLQSPLHSPRFFFNFLIKFIGLCQIEALQF